MNERITDAYWMQIAMTVAEASTCRAKVGCVLIYRQTIVGVGYVGSVHGDEHCCVEKRSDNHLLMPTERKGSTDKGNTCIRTVHAEMNAVLKCTVRGSGQNGWMACYTTYQPCLDCLKVLLQIGVRNICYLKPYQDEWRDAYVEQVCFNGMASFEFQNFVMQRIEMP